jgi:hypothetical protein
MCVCRSIYIACGRERLKSGQRQIKQSCIHGPPGQGDGERVECKHTCCSALRTSAGPDRNIMFSRLLFCSSSGRGTPTRIHTTSACFGG